jgi:hypothetical protein
MKLSKLLHQREALLRQTRLANLAYAYRRFGDFAARIAGARLHGKVCLQPADPAAELYWPVLTALEGNQSVIEEHFTDEDILELEELIFFVTGDDGMEAVFRLEAIEARFMRPLRRQLVQAGISLETEIPAIE